MITHGSMFSGIEGFGLGFLMAGWPVVTVWQSEIDPYCVELLEHHFPVARQLGDVEQIEEFPACEVLTAGFPCQPVSQAGKGLAQDDERWLYGHVERAIKTAKPELVILENVRGLRSRGLGLVLESLRDLGYDCQWDLIPAAAVGAPHLRHRFAIVAYPAGRPYGSIFDVAPPVFEWADEEPFLPRLIKAVPKRKPRLAALGNSVVPQWACYLAYATDRARKSAAGAAPATLFGHTVESYNGSLPYTGLLLDGLVHETPTCAPKLDGKRLWPTAAANDAEWGIDALRATVHVDGTAAGDPHKRLYHPETGQIVQRTLHNYVVGAEEGLWPTPQHADGSGKGAGADRGVQEPGVWRSINLVDAVAEAELWPTATAADAEGSRRSTARTEAWESNAGRTLTDAALEAHELLWPTPRTNADRTGRQALLGDKYGGQWAAPSLEQEVELRAGVLPREFESPEELKGRSKLWPTANASDWKGVAQKGHRRGQLEGSVKDEEGFWPTPGVADASGGRINSPEAREAGVRPSGHRVQTTLADAAAIAERGDAGRTLNPRWVEWLMGYPADWTVIPEAKEEVAA